VDRHCTRRKYPGHISNTRSPSAVNCALEEENTALVEDLGIRRASRQRAATYVSQPQLRDCPHFSSLLSLKFPALTILARRGVSCSNRVSRSRRLEILVSFRNQPGTAQSFEPTQTSPHFQSFFSDSSFSPNDRPPAHDGVLEQNHHRLPCMRSRDLSFVEWVGRSSTMPWKSRIFTMIMLNTTACTIR
jgi:hypothetical protein